MAKTVQKRRLRGNIVSTKMNKTVVVQVTTIKNHPKYNKKYHVSKNYKAHDEHGVGREGQEVVIEACRPISKDKKWRLITS